MPDLDRAAWSGAPAWVLDLDGVVWLGREVIPGVPEAVAEMQRHAPVVFCTNNSALTVAGQEAKLASMGIDAEGAVITSAQAVARLVHPGERVLMAAGPGVAEALAARDVEIVDTGPADAVVIGIHADFDYAELTRIAQAVHGGARLVASNDDASFPTSDGLLPGNGALVAAAETAGGVRAEIAGKPHRPIADAVRSRVGDVGVVVGDRPDTDGRFARELGFRFALMLSGVTAAGDLPVEPEPDAVWAGLPAMVDQVFS